jgi:hypothetical protein
MLIWFREYNIAPNDWLSQIRRFALLKEEGHVLPFNLNLSRFSEIIVPLNGRVRINGIASQESMKDRFVIFMHYIRTLPLVIADFLDNTTILLITLNKP